MNNVNITNTTVNVTKVTNVYNTVIVNRSTTVNNITYVNQRVTNGVTVVSHDAFVNARPVAQNVMRVDAREIAAAPVSHVVAAEPVRDQRDWRGTARVGQAAGSGHQPSGGRGKDASSAAASDRAAAGAGGWTSESAGAGSSGGPGAARSDESRRPARAAELKRASSRLAASRISGNSQVRPDAANATAGVRAAGNFAA